MKSIVSLWRRAYTLETLDFAFYIGTVQYTNFLYFDLYKKYIHSFQVNDNWQLTNRLHFSVDVYCNRSQMKSQRVKNKKGRHEVEWRHCSLHAVTSSVIYYSTHIRKNVIYLFYTIQIQMVYWRIFGTWKKKNKSADVDLTSSLCVSFKRPRSTTNENAHRYINENAHRCIMFSNDEATKLFIAVGTGKFCIDRTSMFTIVDVLTSLNLVTCYYSNDDWAMLKQHCYHGWTTLLTTLFMLASTSLF